MRKPVVTVWHTVCKDEHVHPTLLLAIRLIDPLATSSPCSPVINQIPKDRFTHEMVHFPLLE